MSPPRSRTKTAAEGEELPFEGALGRIEEIVDRLEEGDLPLEEALSAFEEGVRLTKRCATQLEAAERRIEVLLKDGEEWLVRPFEGADGEANPSDPEEDDR
ncbi:MAG: exodeoxyribonuclease VII small subunit [Proteobacteria bacterium]|nr:exodeoxyribonuclease VII small subunit [Pseudomonadota bacterium]